MPNNNSNKNYLKFVFELIFNDPLNKLFFVTHNNKIFIPKTYLLHVLFFTYLYYTNQVIVLLCLNQFRSHTLVKIYHACEILIQSFFFNCEKISDNFSINLFFYNQSAIKTFKTPYCSRNYILLRHFARNNVNKSSLQQLTHKIT